MKWKIFTRCDTKNWTTLFENPPNMSHFVNHKTAKSGTKLMIFTHCDNNWTTLFENYPKMSHFVYHKTAKNGTKLKSFTHCGSWWWIEAKLLINVYTIFSKQNWKKNFCISLSFPLHHVDCWREGDIFPFLLFKEKPQSRHQTKDKKMPPA